MFSNFKLNRPVLTATSLAIAVGLVSCGGPGQQAGEEGAPGSADVVSLSGAGASFPAPLYQRWFSEYNNENPNIQISYQSVGSGAGIKQFLEQTVDFGATDAPLTEEERAQFPEERGRPIQIPTVGGAVVFAFNLSGVDSLQLSRDAYCGIVQGDITNWNDPAIASANEGVALPDSPITFVHRSDGSGTTFIFTNHIGTVCPNWTAGVGKSVEWPVGVGGKGNEGITANVKQTEGAVGYVEFAYARENNLSMAALENNAGNYIEPSPSAAARATEGVQVPEDFAVLLPDPSGEDAYPIIGLTFLLLYAEYDEPAKAETLTNVVNWALSEGDQYAEELGYAPLSQELQAKVIEEIQAVQVATAQ